MFRLYPTEFGLDPKVREHYMEGMKHGANADLGTPVPTSQSELSPQEPKIHRYGTPCCAL
jgi:hypothetical protein